MTITSPLGSTTELQNWRAKLMDGVLWTTGVPPRMSMVKAALVLVPVVLSTLPALVEEEPPETRMRPSSYMAKLPSFGYKVPGTFTPL